MTQEAIVTKLLPNGMAEVAVTRTTACGGNCGSCESCIFQSELKTGAKNLIDAKPGQRVLIESRSSKIYGAALLVYIMPLLLLLFGFALATFLGWSEGAAIAMSFLGLAVGAAVIVLSQRSKKRKAEITFSIVDFL
ncbi:MAG: SoxR reducing system RseC family protein [Oscillospiraceae bacterium]|nr:SoxR reducing system RseC family protein [Oscillospiraceae bacterium]